MVGIVHVDMYCLIWRCDLADAGAGAVSVAKILVLRCMLYTAIWSDSKPPTGLPTLPYPTLPA